MTDPHPNLLSSLRALPRPAWVLFFGTFLNKFGAFVIPFLTLHLTGLGYSLGDAGLAIGAYGAGNLVASVLGGYLADKIGRRKTIVLSMFSAAVAMMCLSMARTWPEIVALTALSGLTGELYRPASSALLADLVTPEQRVTAYAAYRVAFNAGWALGPATAGFLAGHGFFWLFIGDATTSALFGLVAFFALPKGLRLVSDNASWSEALKPMLKDVQLHRVLLATMAIAPVFFQMSSTLGLHVIHLGFSGQVYGLILSLNGGLVVLCELPITTITRRFPARKVMAAGYILSGTGFALNAFAHGIPALASSMVILTFGEMIAMPVAGAYIADLAPAHMRGRYMGVYTLIWALALMVGPAAGMRLFSIGPSVLWLACGAMGLIGALTISSNIKKPSENYCGASV